MLNVLHFLFWKTVVVSEVKHTSTLEHSIPHLDIYPCPHKGLYRKVLEASLRVTKPWKQVKVHQQNCYNIHIIES